MKSKKGSFCSGAINLDLADCSAPQSRWPTIDFASKVVEIDLTKPIDLSKMRVSYAEATPIIDEYERMKMNRKVELYAVVINDGVSEELTITFELKSQRRPKI